MSKVAKLFTNGRSQAVRLPREFRFDGAEVFIRKDPVSGDVILSRRPDGWGAFFAMVEAAPAPEDFLADRQTSAPGNRDPFAA